MFIDFSAIDMAFSRRFLPIQHHGHLKEWEADAQAEARSAASALLGWLEPELLHGVGDDFDLHEAALHTTVHTRKLLDVGRAEKASEAPFLDFERF
jgi:hypothetical protein